MPIRQNPFIAPNELTGDFNQMVNLLNVLTTASVYQAITSVATSQTLTAGILTGSLDTLILNFTGTLTAATTAQLDTVANVVAAFQNIIGTAATVPGIGFVLRVINSSAGAFAVTLTTNTGWTLSGTQSVAQNTFRDFLITINSPTTATCQSIGVGTQS